jgi:DNA-binding IclR family transcriptional regulator
VVKPNPYALDSVSNALRVIGLLGERGTITVTEVAVELGIGKSTAHRLLMTLVAEDFATRDPVHRRYHAGRALVGAGLSLLGEFDVRKRASKPMRRLTEKTGETTKLLILEGPFARVLEVVETGQSLRISGSVGQLLPANATAGGKLLLCNETEEALRERFGRHLPPVTDDTITDWNQLMVELTAIRRARRKKWSRRSARPAGPPSRTVTTSPAGMARRRWLTARSPSSAACTC